MTALATLARHAGDVRWFGPLVLTRVFRKAGAHGYTTIHTRFGQFLYRRGERDLSVLRQMFGVEEYSLDRFPQAGTVRAAYDAILAQGRIPLIVDAGANAGYAARWFARAWPEARILCVEPSPSNVALCRANTCHLPQIEVLHAAIGSTPGMVSVSHTAGEGLAARTERATHGGAALVPVVTVDELHARVSGSDLFVVKVDIEGFEADLFAENTGWAAEAHVVIAEPHDWMLPGQRSSRTMQQAMAQLGRDMLIVGENLVWVRDAGQGV